MSEVNSLQQIIELNRRNLNCLAAQKGLQDPAVMKQSFILDELINQYTKKDISSTLNR